MLMMCDSDWKWYRSHFGSRYNSGLMRSAQALLPLFNLQHFHPGCTSFSFAMLLQVALGSSNLAIAQLVEHLTVDSCSDQMVPGSIPGGQILQSVKTVKFGIKANMYQA